MLWPREVMRKYRCRCDRRVNSSSRGQNSSVKKGQLWSAIDIPESIREIQLINNVAGEPGQALLMYPSSKIRWEESSLAPQNKLKFQHRYAPQLFICKHTSTNRSIIPAII